MMRVLLGLLCCALVASGWRFDYFPRTRVPRTRVITRLRQGTQSDDRSPGAKKNYGPGGRYDRGSKSNLVRSATVELRETETVAQKNGVAQPIYQPKQAFKPNKITVESVQPQVAIVSHPETNTIETVEVSSPAATVSQSSHSSDTIAAVSVIDIPPPLQLSFEDDLRVQVGKEVVSRGKRLQELSQLEKQLSLSMARKLQMEESIIREVQSLFPRIQEELEKEGERVDQLSNVLRSIDVALQSKVQKLVSEQKTLTQMKDLLQQISEDVVRKSMDSAISKKVELVNIEQGICNDLAGCKANIEAEITDAQNKLQSMNMLLSKLPDARDMREGALRYTWTDVETLQAQLVQSIERSRNRDVSVKNFMDVFDRATARKDAMLGLTNSNKAKNRASSNAAGARAEVGKTSESFSIVEKKSYNELSKLAMDAAIKSSTAAVAIAVGLMQATVSFVKSNEGAKSREAAAGSISAFSSVVKSASVAWSATAEAWETGYSAKMPPEEPPSVADYAAGVTTGIETVIQSDKVKEALAGITQGSQKTTKGVTEATTQLTRKMGEDLSANRALSAAAAEFVDGITLLGQVSVAAVGKILKPDVKKISNK